MLLYNITIILEETAANEWLTWMQGVQVPMLMDTGKFVSNRLLKVVDSPNEGVTYCVQFVLDNKANYDSYQSEYGSVLQDELNTRFKNRHVTFQTLMEYVD